MSDERAKQYVNALLTTVALLDVGRDMFVVPIMRRELHAPDDATANAGIDMMVKLLYLVADHVRTVDEKHEPH